ncbi:DUF6179 domain-containing protein [Metaclostridioides mangenotii]|uniref:DUF6179 domain-containing protein n=1 Tax=Metaclostridioides mangenotii TaxID=1540 RepID=UPI0026EBD5EC|nr:DUF6179 domain-containing protein [Clostridioides mangenotii]
MELQKIYGTWTDKTTYGKSKFTIDVLNKSFQMDLISKDDLYRVQSEVANILKKLILKYTNGQSSSIKVETAEEIMNSIWYAVDSYNIKFETIEDIVNTISNKRFIEIYEEGLEKLRVDFEYCKKLYTDIVKDDFLLKFENIAYKDTVYEGFTPFLEKYDIEFSANNSMASIDYPLGIEDDMTVEGIVYAKNYLECMYAENKFCSLLSQNELQDLLNEYGRNYKIDYRVILINIFEITTGNMVFSTFLGKEIGKLKISQYELNYLESFFRSLNEKEQAEEIINSKVDSAFQIIIEKLNIEDKNLINYLFKFQKKFSEEILTAAKNGLIKNMLFIEEVLEIKHDNLVISEDDRMGDSAFRELYNKILQCNSKVDKINLINTNVNSLKDFVDILESNCLFEDEIEFLFIQLGDVELSILGTIIFCDALRNGEVDLLKELMDDIKYTDEEWKDIYIKQLRFLDIDRINKIEEYINQKITTEN